jgi:hypothetical protein
LNGSSGRVAGRSQVGPLYCMVATANGGPLLEWWCPVVVVAANSGVVCDSKAQTSPGLNRQRGASSRLVRVSPHLRGIKLAQTSTKTSHGIEAL